MIAMPRVAYALISLALRNPIDTTLPLERGAPENRETQFVTVALNETLIDKLLAELALVKKHLEKAQKAAHLLEEQAAPKTTNGPNN